MDWIELYGREIVSDPWVLVFKREAETYDSGGSTVDAIHPQNVTVGIYDGDPDGGGIQIGSNQVASDASKITASGPTTPILTAGGSNSVMVTWTATPEAGHNIYARILPDPLETNTGNNKAFSFVDVIIIPTLSEWGLILLLLLLTTAAVLVIRKRRRAEAL